MSHEPPGNGAHPPHARPQFCLQSAEISSEPWTLISASSFLLPSSHALEKSKLSHGIHAALMGLSSCTRTARSSPTVSRNADDGGHEGQ